MNILKDKNFCLFKQFYLKNDLQIVRWIVNYTEIFCIIYL